MYRIVVQNHVIINSFYVSDIIRHNIIVELFKMHSKLKTRYSSSHISSASILNKDLIFSPVFISSFLNCSTCFQLPRCICAWRNSKVARECEISRIRRIFTGACSVARRDRSNYATFSHKNKKK